MNPRERTLAIILLSLIVVVGGGFAALKLFIDPIRTREASIAVLQQDIQKKRDEISRIYREKKKLDRWRQMSLPADADLAGREYEKYLSDLLRQSQFPAGTFTIETRKDAKAGPTLPGKKDPLWTKLTCTVTTQGELSSLVGFLERFYRTGLIHQIKKLAVQRPITASPGQKATALDMSLTIEALVLQGADNRPYLAPLDQRMVVLDVLTTLRHGPPGVPLGAMTAGPAGPLGARRLAAQPRQYASILGKNIFFGPPLPPPPPPPKVVEKKEAAPPPPPVDKTDVPQFVYLTDITHTPTKVEAFLFDRYNNRTVRLRSSPGFDSFRIRNEQGDTLVAGKVIRIEDRDVVFQANDKYYAFHIGKNLREALAAALTDDEIKERKLKPLKAAKPAEKPAETKKPEPGPDVDPKDEKAEPADPAKSDDKKAGPGTPDEKKSEFGQAGEKKVPPSEPENSEKKKFDPGKTDDKKKPDPGKINENKSNGADPGKSGSNKAEPLPPPDELPDPVSAAPQGSRSLAIRPGELPGGASQAMVPRQSLEPRPAIYLD